MALVTTPIPGASGYAGADLLAKTAYQNALTRLNQSRQQSLRDYGYKGDIAPDTGVIQNLLVDPSNQYGQYQTMLRDAAGQANSTDAENTSRGLGHHGGLAGQAEAQDRYAFGGASASLGQNVLGTLTGYQDTQNQAGYTRDEALWQAEQAAARQAIQDAAFNQADLSGMDSGYVPFDYSGYGSGEYWQDPPQDGPPQDGPPQDGPPGSSPFAGLPRIPGISPTYHLGGLQLKHSLVGSLSRINPKGIEPLAPQKALSKVAIPAKLNLTPQSSPKAVIAKQLVAKAKTPPTRSSRAL